VTLGLSESCRQQLTEVGGDLAYQWQDARPLCALLDSLSYVIVPFLPKQPYLPLTQLEGKLGAPQGLGRTRLVSAARGLVEGNAGCL